MNRATRLSKDDQVVDYINDSIRMLYRDEQNVKKDFWWWLNKLEFVANIFEVPNDKMGKLFIEMVDENIHERVKEKYPAIIFTKLSYVEIINYYIRYFNYSPEILSHRKTFWYRNHYEQEAIKNYADNLQQIFNNCIYKDLLERKIAEIYIRRFKDIELRIYLREVKQLLTVLLFETRAIKFAKVVLLSRYINPALSIINTYNLTNEDKFHEWLNKFEYILNITKVSDDRMIEFFNNMVDIDVHSAVKMKYPSIKSSKLSYEEKINYYLRYFASNDSDFHKIRLSCRKQYKHETINSFAYYLRKLFHKCSYTCQLDEMLCEQFPDGIRDNEISIVLKKFSCVSFKDMVEFANELTTFKQKATYLQPNLVMLNTYHGEEENIFYTWFNKFEYVINIIGIPQNEIIEFFNDMVDNDVHARVQEYYPLVKFSKLPYEEIVNHYLRCLCSSTEENLHGKRLICRKQYEQETLIHFVDSLIKIQYHRNYDVRFEEELRQQFRNGIHDDQIKTYIDKYPDLPFNAIVAIAIGYSNELMFMENE